MKLQLSSSITYFGKTNFRHIRKHFGIMQNDRFFHTLITGKTGVGKSNFLLCKIFQDIKHGNGVCVFDVHGDLIKTIRENIPQHRSKDLVYLDIPNPNLDIGYNPLKKVSYEKRSLVAGGLLETFKRIFGGAWGIRLEHILRYILLTLLDQPQAKLSDIVRIIHDMEYREQCKKNIVNPDVKKFWDKEYDKYGKADLVPILSKVGAFLAHPAIKRVLIDNKDSLSLRRAMDSKQIILVNLSKGALGVDIANLMGSLLVSSLSLAAFSRVDIPEEKRVPFFVYLDEFQNFTSSSLITMLSELRKFRCALILAHQYLGQIKEEIRLAIFGNVGTIICFRIGAKDSLYFQQELFLYPMQLEIDDFISLENYHAYIKLMIDGKSSKPFSIITLPYTDYL